MICFLIRGIARIALLALAVGSVVAFVEADWTGETRTLQLRLRDVAEARALWLDEYLSGAFSPLESFREQRERLEESTAAMRELSRPDVSDEDRKRLEALIEEKLGN